MALIVNSSKARAIGAGFYLYTSSDLLAWQRRIAPAQCVTGGQQKRAYDGQLRLIVMQGFHECAEQEKSDSAGDQNTDWHGQAFGTQSNQGERNGREDKSLVHPFSFSPNASNWEDRRQ